MKITTPDYLSYDIVVAAATAIAALLVLFAIKILVARQLHRFAAAEHFKFLDMPEQILKATRLPFMLGVALLVGVSQLDMTPRQEKWFHYAWVVILISQLALWANEIIAVFMARALERQRAENPAGATHMMVTGLIVRIIVWSLAVLAVLDNLGFNITTLMASLGIGGVAVALAAQNILGDVFSSISIALDKPFVIGDFIVVDDYMGTVEYVGLKTTRLCSLGGEQIVISNSELLKNKIRNYKRMQERRVLFEFGIAYETPLEKIRMIPGMLKEIITAPEMNTRFDRAHFKSYGDSALQFEVVYYVLDADYNVYMDIQQKINLSMLLHFRRHGIVFAYPTRTLYISGAESDREDASPKIAGLMAN